MRFVHDSRQLIIVSGGDRLCWMNPGDEAQFRLVHVADPSKIALIEQCICDLDVGRSSDPADGVSGIPIVTQNIRTPVTEQLSLTGRPNDVDVGQSIADGGPVGGCQNSPNLKRRTASPLLAVSSDPPCAIHAQRRVQDDVGIDVHEDLFAATPHCLDDVSTQIDRCVRRHPEIADRELLAS